MISGERLYRLPFDPVSEIVISQGWHGPFSHQDIGFPDKTYAVDLRVPFNTLVRAAREGRVIAAVDSQTDYYQGLDPDIGLYQKTNFVVVEHREVDGSLSMSLYSHLHNDSIPNEIKLNNQVTAGQIIGRTGPSGWLAVPHLHFQVLARNNPDERLMSQPFKFIEYPNSLEDSEHRTKK